MSFLEYKIIAVGEYSLNIGGIIGVILSLLLTKIILVLVLRYSKKRVERFNIDQGRFYSLFLIFRYLIWTFTILLCLNLIGVEVSVLLAGAAALLVGVGLGLQDIFSDLISGFIILMEGTIEIGDVVDVDGVVGRVDRLSIRQSTITTQDDISILVPNHKFTRHPVINWSHNDEASRFHVNVGVSYGTDTNTVRKVLMDVMLNHMSIEKSPRPFVRFNDFGDSSLDFQLFFWSMRNFDNENLKSDLRFQIDRVFRENNIEIPFPQRDVHVKSKI